MNLSGQRVVIRFSNVDCNSLNVYDRMTDSLIWVNDRITWELVAQTDIAVLWVWHRYFGNERNCLAAIIKRKRSEVLLPAWQRLTDFIRTPNVKVDCVHTALAGGASVSRGAVTNDLSGLYLRRFGFNLARDSQAAI